MLRLSPYSSPSRPTKPSSLRTQAELTSDEKTVLIDIKTCRQDAADVRAGLGLGAFLQGTSPEPRHASTIDVAAFPESRRAPNRRSGSDLPDLIRSDTCRDRKRGRWRRPAG